MRERAKRASASETYIFRSPNTSAHTINAVPLYYFGMTLYRQYNDKILTLRESMSMRASIASELRIFFTFSHSKTAISFNILLVLQILCLRNTFIQCTDNKYMYLYRARERSERAPQKHIFSGLKYICIHKQSMQFL